ncbi:MAG: hypothetical protein FT726_09340 [Pantoea sp. Morm]|uniref:conjugation system SOS inhibitor PsiB family protein n=1 Tax=Pantoea sp. Morm TaxID=2601250 RepID=UPI001DB8847E|nr:hypothetical protein [Pantoea sp. Morm]
MLLPEKKNLHSEPALTGCDFEAYRDRGEIYRQRISAAVLNALLLSDSWRMDCEMRAE